MVAASTRTTKPMNPNTTNITTIETFITTTTITATTSVACISNFFWKHTFFFWPYYLGQILLKFNDLGHFSKVKTELCGEKKKKKLYVFLDSPFIIENNRMVDELEQESRLYSMIYILSFRIHQFAS